MDEGDLDTTRPFTRADLVRAGMDRSILRRAEYVQIVGRVWVRRNSIDRETLIRAALCLHPASALASHLSAAQVLGLPVPEHPFAHVTVFKHEDRRFRRQIKPHVTTKKRKALMVRGIRTTDPVATFIDCAGWLSLVDLVILGDAIVKKFKISPGGLRRACSESTDYYAGLARAAAELVRKGVDSPMETRLRLLIVFAGLPEPVVNFKTYWEDGTWKRRFDLCYPSIKLIVEYDGRQHAEDPKQWRADIERREEFDDEGYRVIVVTAEGIYQEPAVTLHRIRRQLVLRGWPDVPSIDAAWQDHFAA